MCQLLWDLNESDVDIVYEKLQKNNNIVSYVEEVNTEYWKETEILSLVRNYISPLQFTLANNCKFIVPT